MFDNARAKVRKVDRPSIWIRGRLGRFEDSVHHQLDKDVLGAVGEVWFKV